MRVLLCSGSDRGGFAVYAKELATRLDQTGVELRVCTPDGAGGTLRMPASRWGEEIAHWGRVRLYAARTREMAVRSWTLLDSVRQVQADVIHLSTPIAPRVDPLLTRLLRRHAPVVVTVHNAVPHGDSDPSSAALQRCWREADALVVHGQQAKCVVQAAAPDVPVRVIPVDLVQSVHPYDRGEARRQLGLGTEPVVAMLGLVRPYKGFDILGDAWPEVRSAHPDACLAVVGSAAHPVDAVDALCRLPGVRRRPGWVSDDEFDQWAAAADVGAFPYRHGSHSSALHRFVAAGTPVLASPPLREEVERLHAGRIVDLRPAAWVSALAEALGDRPIPRPTPLPFDQAADHVALYRELVAARGREPSPAGAGGRR